MSRTQAPFPIFIMPPPPIDAETKLLLKMDGSEGSQVIVDSSLVPKAPIASANMTLTQTQKKFGTASGVFTGTNSYVQVPGSGDFSFGTGAYTLDLWARITSLGGGQYHWFFCTHINGSYFTRLGYNSSGQFRYEVEYGTSTKVHTTTFSGVGGDSNWHHIAFCRQANGPTLVYYDGVNRPWSGGNPENAANLVSSTLYIGGDGKYNQNYMIGNIDEYRISKGVCRWTSDFTPPTNPY